MRLRPTGPSRCLFVALLAVVSLGASGSDLRLVEAAKHQDTESVRVLLKRGVDVNAPQGDGATALQWAAYWDDPEMADLLIRARARVGTANDLGVTPLWLASMNGSSAMVERLLKAGANPNAKILSGETPLMAASRSGNAAAVQMLLAHGADVNAEEASAGQTALMWAVAQRHQDVVQALIEGGADVRARTRSWHELVNIGDDRDVTGLVDMAQGGFTPLLFATRNGDVTMAKVLLAAGANVNDVAAAGMSALVIAAHSGYGTLAAFLLEIGADPNAAEGGYTALHIAVRRRDVDLVKALLAHGANPNAVLMKGTPLRRLSGVDMSLHYSLVGATPLWMAARFRDPDMMRLLAANGGNPSLVKRDDGTTVLMAAVVPFDIRGVTMDPAKVAAGGCDVVSAKLNSCGSENKSLEAVKVALELGGDVNASNNVGNTALHGAAELGYDTVVQFLVDNGAKLDLKNKLGRPPIAMTGACEVPPLFRMIPGRPDVSICNEQKSTAALLRKLGAAEWNGPPRRRVQTIAPLGSVDVN